MLEEYLNKYRETFGENYPLCTLMGMSDSEIINDIKRCIKSNKEAKQPEYEDGCDY